MVTSIARQHRGQALRRDVLDVGLAPAQRVDDAGVDVDPDDLDALLGEGDGERQPDVAEADDPDPHARASGDVTAMTTGA